MPGQRIEQLAVPSSFFFLALQLSTFFGAGHSLGYYGVCIKVSTRRLQQKQTRYLYVDRIIRTPVSAILSRYVHALLQAKLCLTNSHSDPEYRLRGSL